MEFAPAVPKSGVGDNLVCYQVRRNFRSRICVGSASIVLPMLPFCRVCVNRFANVAFEFTRLNRKRDHSALECFLKRSTKHNLEIKVSNKRAERTHLLYRQLLLPERQ